MPSAVLRAARQKNQAACSCRWGSIMEEGMLALTTGGAA